LHASLGAVGAGGHDHTASLDLSPQARQQLEAEKVDLGAAEVPEGVSGETAASVEGAVAESFVAGFRVAMVAAAIFCGERRGVSADNRGQRQRTAHRAGDGSGISSGPERRIMERCHPH
jgi:hypothetical protein